MENVRVAFQVNDEGEVAPAEYQEIRCHHIFDIKETAITRKVSFVAGGNMMDTPAAMTYVTEYMIVYRTRVMYEYTRFS